MIKNIFIEHFLINVGVVQPLLALFNLDISYAR